MLRDILEDAIAAQPDMELVAPSQDADAPASITREQPDVVILADEGMDLTVARVKLVSNARRLGLLTVTGSGREAHLVELRQTWVHDASAQGLLDAIRAEFGPPLPGRGHAE